MTKTESVLIVTWVALGQPETFTLHPSGGGLLDDFITQQLQNDVRVFRKINAGCTPEQRQRAERDFINTTRRPKYIYRQFSKQDDLPLHSVRTVDGSLPTPDLPLTELVRETLDRQQAYTPDEEGQILLRALLKHRKPNETIMLGDEARRLMRQIQRYEI